MKLHKTKTDKELFYYFNAKKEKMFMYRHRYYDSLGKRREKSKQGFKSENAAYRELLEVKSTILNGGVKQIENDNLTISEWLDIWYNTKNHLWEISTQYQRSRYIEGVIKPLIGHLRLSKMDSMTYERVFIKKLLDRYAPSSVKTYHSIVKMAINAAVKNGTVRNNVLDSIMVPDNRQIKENFLTADELKILLETSKKKTNITNYTMIYLLAYSGFRKGEAQGLRWSDIDFKNEMVTIERTRDHDGVRPPKTKRSYRTIQISDKVLKQLKVYQNWCKQLKFSYGEKLSEDDFVFITTHGGNLISPNTINLAMNTVIKHAGIKRITPHGLRHTHATILLNEGTSIATVAKRLGNTAQEINRTYGHSNEDEDKRANETFLNAINF